MKTILIIEDDISILKGLKDTLKYEGYIVRVETNGIRGSELALEKKVDLILLDIMLPGMNGYEICRKIKALNKTAEEDSALIRRLEYEIKHAVLANKRKEADLLLHVVDVSHPHFRHLYESVNVVLIPYEGEVVPSEVLAISIVLTPPNCLCKSLRSCSKGVL